MAGHHPPVTDWSTDFDHTDPAWVADPYPIWGELRGHCPVAHSERYGGVWLPTRYDDVSAVAYDTEHFTSQGVIVSEMKPIAPRPVGPAPPITSDPPFHGKARRLLLPAFAPKPIAELEGSTRALCRSLLDSLAGRTEVDAATEYAQHIPPAVIATMLGLPLEDQDLFRDFIHRVLEAVDVAPEVRQANVQLLSEYLDAHIEAHRREPRDDLIDYLLRAEVDGHRLTPEHVRGTVILLLVAGIDTTWSAIGASIWHLAQHPDDRRRLIDDPEVWPFAIEELLRAYAPVTMARLVAHEVDLAGQTLHEGDWLLLSFPAANRDPAAFDDADRFVIDRQVNRHAAFGLGIHRCLGSNLARMELRIALEEWMARLPEFELADPTRVTWSAGQVRGPRTLPLRIPA